MNAITIEQDSGDVRLAFEVNQNAAIANVRLARARVQSQPLDERPPQPISVSFTYRSKQLQGPAELLRLEIGFRMVGKRETAGGEEPASGDKNATAAEHAVIVDCAYEVDYSLREGFTPTAEHVKAFKDGNAIFNAWPYFREYLQNSLLRMGLPPLVAPFLRLQPKAKPEQEVPTDSASPGPTKARTERKRTLKRRR